MLREKGRDRFLTRSMAIWLTVYAVFALSFALFQVQQDALVYFNLMRRFFGERPDFAFAYQFGSDVWNGPFYLVGRGLGAIFGLQPETFHVTFEEISMTFAAQAALITTLYLGWRILRELGLPAKASVLFLTVFGSPLFWYAVFEPAMKHVTDTLYITAALFFLLRLLSAPRDRDAIFLGALAGISANTRYINVSYFFVVGCFLMFGRRRSLTLAVGAALVVGLVVFSLPALRGIGYFLPSYFPKSAAGRVAFGATPMLADTHNPLNGFDPLIPLRMLFSDHRGLFFWTPLTFLGTIGFVVRLRGEHDPVRRRFLWIVLCASAALLVSHVTWAEWDGAYSFSSRFLTALFPLELIGVAELVRRFGRWTYPVFAVCIAWSMTLALIHWVGYDGITAGDSATTMIRDLAKEPTNMRHKVDGRVKERYVYLWALVKGHDPEHLNDGR